MRKGNIRTRLDEDIALKVGKIIRETGWTESNTVNILVRAGLLATTGDPKAAERLQLIEATRKMIEATTAANAVKPGKEKRLL